MTTSSRKELTWPEFRDRYEEQNLYLLSERARCNHAKALDHVERVLAPKLLADITPESLDRLSQELRETVELPEAKIAHYLKCIRSAIECGANYVS